jgi:hypothetical protein
MVSAAAAKLDGAWLSSINIFSFLVLPLARYRVHRRLGLAVSGFAGQASLRQVSLSQPRFRNGHRQSGGHWNAALGLVVRGSTLVGSVERWSGSAAGTLAGVLFIWLILLPGKRLSSEKRGGASLLPRLRHQEESGGRWGDRPVPSKFSLHQVTIALSRRLFKIAQPGVVAR